MTNPDTNTLNGALEQLGITMADNLVTMGVSDADPSDGLTTLAGKILEIAPVPPTPTPSSISLTGTKSILSYADSEQSVLTATVLDANDDPMEGVTVTFYNGSTSMGTADTNSSGIASKTYSSAGAGDIVFTAEVGSLLSETYSVQDCIDWDDATIDRSSKYGSSISLRNAGTSSISYDSTNKYYNVNITKANSESFIPISSADGLDDVIIEFDAYLPSSSTSLVGLCFYKDSNNWARLGTKTSAMEYGGSTNGSYSETNISGTSAPINTWLHHKFTITNDTIHRQVYNGSTLIYEDTRTYTGFFTSTTKYGFTALWSTGWKQYFKNIKIKPLKFIDVSATADVLSYSDSTQQNPQTSTLTATVNPIESGKTVKIYQDDVLVATEQTDSNGQVSYTYTSQGIGDVEFKFKSGSLVSESYTVHDWLFNDSATSDKTANYTQSTIEAFTFDTDHYILTRSRNDISATNYYSYLYPTNISDLPSNYEISVDWKFTSKGNEMQSGFHVSDAHNTTYSGINELLTAIRNGDIGLFYRVNGSLTRYNTAHTPSTNTWYNLKMTVQGTSVTTVIKQGSTEIYNQTQTLSSVSNWKKLQLILGGNSQTIHWKNWSVKPL